MGWAYYIKSEKPKEPKHQPAPKITIADVMEIARKIDEETGRYPSYGYVSAGIETGRIVPDDYLERGNQNGRKHTKHRSCVKKTIAEKAESGRLAVLP